MQEPNDKETLAAIEQALSQITKGLEGMHLLRVLERVSYENKVDQDYFDRWTLMNSRARASSSKGAFAKISV
jgi:hypothetical protein